MRSYLIRLREEFILRMESIENEGREEKSVTSEAGKGDTDVMFEDEDVFDSVDLESLG